jgi:site-specific DNA recombinase
MQAAQDPSPAVLPLPGQDTDALIAGFDTRLARYQAALDAGADPEAVAEWTRQVQAERAAVLARAASRDHHKPARRLTEDDIRTLITGLGDLRDVVRDAEPAVKAAVYEQLGLRVTTCPEKTNSGPTSRSARRHSPRKATNMGKWVVSEGGLEHPFRCDFPGSGKSCNKGNRSKANTRSDSASCSLFVLSLGMCPAGAASAGPLALAWPTTAARLP